MSTGTSLSLLEAAQRVGKSKPTILRAIQAGRISATRDEPTGEWRIEPAELFRLYAPLPEGTDETVREGGDETSRTASTDGRNALNDKDGVGVARTVAELEALKRELEQEREERARERRQLEDSLSDLRGERDRLLGLLEEQAGAVKLLTDARQQPKRVKRRGWWPWRGQ